MTPAVWGVIALAVVLSPDGGNGRPDGGLERPDGGYERPDGATPPRGLSCLPTWYAGTVIRHPEAGWGLELPDGTWLPWRTSATDRGSGDGGFDEGESGDGGQDAGADSEAAATLADLYRAPYVGGPIRPIDSSDAGPLEDPGRIRVEELLRATYGKSREEVASRLVKVRFFGLRYPFHERAGPALARVVERLTPEVRKDSKLGPFLTNIGGTWSWRRIARSKNLSTHAWGIAIDLNADRAHYWRWTRRGEPLVWRNSVPQAIVDAFEAEGFIWGGRWQHFDTMHFEYRPELLSQACREEGEGVLP